MEDILPAWGSHHSSNGLFQELVLYLGMSDPVILLQEKDRVLKTLLPGLHCIVGLLEIVNIDMCLLLIGQKSNMATVA